MTQETLSIRPGENEILVKETQLTPRTPEPTRVAARYCRYSPNLNWRPTVKTEAQMREWHQAMLERAKELERGAEPKPITAFLDNKIYYLASGFLEFAALRRCMQNPVVTIYDGTAEDAEIFALSTGQALPKEDK